VTYEAARWQRACDALNIDHTRCRQLGEPVPTGNVVAKAKERRRAANEVCEWMEERFVAGAIGEFAFGAMVTVIKEQQVAPSIVSPAKRQVFADELKLGKFVEE